MARTQVRPAAGAVTWPTDGGSEIPIELPKDAAYRGLMLDLSVVYTVGNGTGATATASIVELIKNVRLVADGKLTLYSIDGFSLREFNRFWFGSVPPEDTFSAGDGTYGVQLYLPIAPPYLFDESTGLLPAVPLSGLQLFVNLGTPANLLTTAGTSTFAATLNVETHEVLDLDPRLQVSPMIVTQLTENIVTGARVKFDLPSGNRIAQLMTSDRSLDGSTTVFQAAMTAHSEVEVSIPGGGPTVLRNTRLVSNRAFNRIFGSGRRSGQATDLAAGFQVHNFVEDALATSPLDVSGDASIKAFTEQTATGTSPTRVYTIVEQIPRPVAA